MSQHDYVIDNQSAPASRTDLNNVLAAIRTVNSGATAPASTVADMLWYETDTFTLWKRNAGNSAWVSLGVFNETTLKFEPNQTFASNAQATAGTDNTVAMTPLRVAQAIAAQVSSTNYQVFTASGTWTKPAGISANAIVIVQMWAAGGGGGKGDSTNTMAAGGGGGGFTQVAFLASSLAATQSVTVGLGGAGGTTSNVGSAGGLSQFASAIVYGGSGGGSGGSSGNRSGARGGGWSNLGINEGGLAEDGGATTAPSQFGGGAGSGAGQASLFGAFWGGGGGKSSSGAGVSTSVFGGAGGAAATAGTAPGGGGGGKAYVNDGTTGGAGARGEVRVWTIG